MNNTWTVLISAFSGLAGAGIGGWTGYVSNKSIKLLEWKQTVRNDEINTKQELYVAFLGELSRLQLAVKQEEATSATERMMMGVTRFQGLKELEKITNLFGQIRLISTNPVIKAAVILLHYARIICGADQREEGKSYVDCLENMASAARNELDALRASPL